MAFIGNIIDPNAQPQEDFAPIPSGEYLAIIIESDMKPTRNNDGQYLELAYRIVDGEYAGRQVWTRLNLDNKNAQTVAIANQQLAAIRVACGLQRVDQSEQLHNIPHVIRVEFIPAGTKRRNGTVTERDTNEVKAWKAPANPAAAAAAVGNVAPSAPLGFPSAAPAAAPAPVAVPPSWAKPAA